MDGDQQADLASTLDALRYDWSEAYEIEADGDLWRACRRDGKGGWLEGPFPVSPPERHRGQLHGQPGSPTRWSSVVMDDLHGAAVVPSRAPGEPVSAVPGKSSATPPFAALPTAPGMARGHVRATFAGWGLAVFADSAEAIASELVTNAVEASNRAPVGAGALVIRLCLLINGDVLTIECWDQAPGFPALRHADGLAETGRGLAIIDAITGGRWGCRPAIGQDGKCVWAVLPLRDTPARQFPARSAHLFLPTHDR
jgi:Histidine kinase-like ATPase domain